MGKLVLLVALGIFAIALGSRPRGLKKQTYERPLMLNSRAIYESLYIDNPYHEAGSWGSISLCANDGFATSAEITYKAPAFDHLDETAVNGVRLYCNGVDGQNDGYVESTVGAEGESQGDKICSSSTFITGFRANTLEYQGAFTDDVAVEDIEISCDYGLEILDTVPDATTRSRSRRPSSKGFKLGEWSSFTDCSEGAAVCGLQTRYEDASLGDATAICEFVFFCCLFPATNATIV